MKKFLGNVFTIATGIIVAVIIMGAIAATVIYAVAGDSFNY